MLSIGYKKCNMFCHYREINNLTPFLKGLNFSEISQQDRNDN